MTPAEGEAEAERTPLEHLRHCLRMDEAKADGDERPTLVYLHWPHEHATHGALVTDMCTKALDDEACARWGRLFRCVQIDMAASDRRLIELLGSDGKPGLLALDADAKVVARIPASPSPGRVQKALEAAIQRFPARWKRIQKDMDDQAKRVAAAKRLAKDDRLAEALAEVERISMAQVRIGAAYDEAAFLVHDLSQRLARAKERDASK